jgi:hypothetical protein
VVYIWIVWAQWGSDCAGHFRSHQGSQSLLIKCDYRGGLFRGLRIYACVWYTGSPPMTPYGKAQPDVALALRLSHCHDCAHCPSGDLTRGLRLSVYQHTCENPGHIIISLCLSTHAHIKINTRATQLAPTPNKTLNIGMFKREQPDMLGSTCSNSLHQHGCMIVEKI